jgi:hypothetical protein
VTEKLRAGLADLAAQAAPIDLHRRVHKGARRIERRNRALGFTAAAVLAAGSLAVYVALRPTVAGPDPSVSPSPSVTTRLPEVDLRNATFTVPIYPGPWGAACPGGERTFVDGMVDTQPGSKLYMNPTLEVLRGDLDGQPGDERVVRIQCATEGGSDDNPLAVKVSPDGAITTLGWVNVDADGELLVLDPAEPIELAAGSIRVFVIGRYGDLPQNLDKQARTYAARNGTLAQTAGPTTFEQGTTDAGAIDLRNTTLYLATNDGPGAGGSVNAYLGFVKTAAGAGSANFEKIVDGTDVGSVVVTVAVRQTLIVRTGGRETPVAVIDVKPADGPQRTVVVAYHHDQISGYAARDPWTVVTSKAGETITSVTGDDGQLTLGMTANGVAAVRAFRFNSDPAGARWVEV